MGHDRFLIPVNKWYGRTQMDMVAQWSVHGKTQNMSPGRQCEGSSLGGRRTDTQDGLPDDEALPGVGLRNEETRNIWRDRGCFF